MTPSTLPQYEDCVLTSDTLTLASKSDVVVIRGVDLRQAKFIPTTAPGSTTTVYVIHLLDVNGKEYLLALGSLADQKTWTNTASGAAQALRDIRVVMGEGGSGPGGGQVDSVVAGDAIAVDATDPANPIVDVLVDGVTIGFNGSNQLEVPAGGGGYVPTTRTINTTAPLTGGGNLSADRTLAVSDFTNGARGTVPASGGGTTNFLRADQTWAAPPAGTVTNVTATLPLLSSGGATPDISASTSDGGNEVADAGKLLIFGTRGTITGSGDTGANGVEGTTSGAGVGVYGVANGSGVGVVGEGNGGGNGATFSSVGGVGVQGQSDVESGGYFLSNGPTNPALHVNQDGAGPIGWLHNTSNLGMEVGNDGGAAWTTATGAQTTATNLPAFGTATKGVVPASGGGTSNFLRADGTFAAPAGTAGITSLTGDVTGTGPGATATTLATVNAGVGTFGSATQTPVLTANAKGLITAVSNTTVTPAVGSITGLGTGVATALAVNVGTAGAPVVNGGDLGTPSAGVATNLTGTATGLTAGALSTETIARLASTFTTSSTTLVDVTGMNVAMLANKDYIVEVDIIWQSSVITTGLWFSLNGPASPNAVVFRYMIPLTLTTNSARNNTGYESSTASVDVPAANTNYYTRLHGMVRNGANAGDLQFRVAAENANNVSVRVGSVIKITQTN